MRIFNFQFNFQFFLPYASLTVRKHCNTIDWVPPCPQIFAWVVTMSSHCYLSLAFLLQRKGG